MTDSTPSRFSILVAEMRDGVPGAKDELVQLVYQDLRRLAQSYLKKERADHLLPATALVHELYLRLFGENRIEWQERSHFFIVAARQMRRILVDYSRTAAAAKRNGCVRDLPLEEARHLPVSNDPEPAELDEALNGLEKSYPRACRVVELRFYVGLTEEEIAKVLDVSVTTVKREWKFARAWLFGYLRGSDHAGHARKRLAVSAMSSGL